MGTVGGAGGRSGPAAGLPAKADRRSRRTRRLVTEALVALMRERRYDRITVRELIDRADIGRSTFYAHYRDKQDVLLSSFESMLHALAEPSPPAGGAPAGALLPSLGLFRHVREHQALYHSLVRGGAVDLVFRAGHRTLRERAQHGLDALVAAGHAPAVPPPVLADYLAGALLTLLRWWLEHQLPYSPEEMDAIFRRLTGSADRVGGAGVRQEAQEDGGSQG